MLRLAQLAVALARTLERSVPFWEHMLPTLHQNLAAAVASKDKCEEVLDAMDLSKPVHFVGAGPAWGTASEGALKLREAAHIQAEGHHLENFLHGPLISVEAGQTVFLMVEPGPGLDRAIEIGKALDSIDVNLVVVGSAADQVDGSDFDLTVHRLPEVLAPIANVVALQWIAYLAAKRRGVNADVFREDEPAYKHAMAQLKL
jgi:glucosamine--fructose-6-phosphate aminotransferase (isomerizing)